MIENFNLKKEALKVAGGIAYVLALLWVIKYFSLGYIGTYIIILVSSVVLMLVSKSFKWKSLLTTSITLAALLAFFYLFGGKLGFVISTSLICIIILYTRRKKFIEVKQHIESMIWGEPLNKFVERGERPPKIKIGK